MKTFLKLLVLMVPAIAGQSTGEGLNRVARAAGKLYFGTATDNPELTDTPYVKILNDTREFGQLTPANSLKWDATEPVQGVFNFTGGDQIFDIAKENGKLFRGHNLVWHEQLPTWLTNGTWTKKTLTAVMENHIKNVAGHYRGQLYAWDVVNEPLNDNGTLGSSPFLSAIGEEYIPIALRAARAADPKAKLYINDFNIEGPGAKSTAMINLVKSLKKQGVPIDGIGVQGHLIVGELPSDIQQNLEAITATGVEVAITELDVRMTLPSTPALLAQQKADYQTVIEACNAVRKCIGVTVWDFTDKATFPGEGAACPWDENLILKPAYGGIIAGFGRN
ncbi:glycoside hydrolase family 10 protein [Ramaria rubella]|nr:glycoside hydrolase family 10 protein [Ramaria rubella]